jgi:hypothetical protein
MDNDHRSVAVGQDELDALNFFLPEHDATPITTGRLPPARIGSAADVSEANNHRGSIPDVGQRNRAAAVVNPTHRSAVTAGKQRRQAFRFRKPGVFTNDVLTTIAIQAVLVCRWLLSSWHGARLRDGQGIARTRTSRRGVNIALGAVRSQVCTYIVHRVAETRARLGGFAAGSKPGWLHAYLPRRRPLWSAAFVSGGVLIGALFVQSFGVRSPQSPSTPERPSTPRSDASAISKAAVVTTLVHKPLEADATSPAPTLPTTGPSGLKGARIYRGGLNIDSQPAGATVFVNNERLGQTPIVLRSLSVGSRAVRLELNGYAPWSRSVRVVVDQSTAVSARLEPKR